MEVTERDLFEVFIEGTNENTALEDVVETIKEKFSITELKDGHVEKVKLSLKRYRQNKKRRYINKRLKVDYEELKCSGDAEVSLFTVEVCEQKQKIRKSLDNIARKQEIRRTEDIWNEVKKFSEKENIRAS